MGEVMTQAIIGMPYDMAMSDELSRRQFHERAQYLLGEHEKLQDENAKLRAELERLRQQRDKLAGLLRAAYEQGRYRRLSDDELAQIKAALAEVEKAR